MTLGSVGHWVGGYTVVRLDGWLGGWVVERLQVCQLSGCRQPRRLQHLRLRVPGRIE